MTKPQLKYPDDFVFFSGELNPVFLEQDARSLSVAIATNGDTDLVIEKPKRFMVAGMDVVKDGVTVTLMTPNAELT